VAQPLTREQTKVLVKDLQELLDRLRLGELDASNGMLLRIEGAITAIEVVLGEADRSDLV